MYLYLYFVSPAPQGEIVSKQYSILTYHECLPLHFFSCIHRKPFNSTHSLFELLPQIPKLFPSELYSAYIDSALGPPTFLPS